MKITILNGNPRSSGFDDYLLALKKVLEDQSNSVVLIHLRELTLRYCIGCWGCWVKTPGQCVNSDQSPEMDRAVINADFVLWAAPLVMGFPSELLKRANDKHLPLIHPYMEVDRGEAHHVRRYPKSPRVGLLLEKEPFTDERDLKIVTDIYCRTALNFKTRLEFSLTTETPIEDLAGRITHPSTGLPLPEYYSATQGVSIASPARLTLLNGSPRGRKGNTPIFLQEIAKGFAGPSEMHHLVCLKQTGEMVQAFAKADCALIGFPLYTDSMPGITKHFFEALGPLLERRKNPPLGFVIQSGFPEGLHSRYVERYVERLAERLGSPYLGTVVKGNGEGTRLMTAAMNARLFRNLQSLGIGLASGERFNPGVLQEIASPERYPRVLGPLFRFFLRLPIAHSYFDGMLKENGSYEQRFDRPFE
ncbi:MAG: flavodoxin family protein [Anaerolineales bacterium]|nr:flavodoxin family protein [Anaerolineales bacterium]